MALQADTENTRNGSSNEEVLWKMETDRTLILRIRTRPELSWTHNEYGRKAYKKFTITCPIEGRGGVVDHDHAALVGG